MSDECRRKIKSLLEGVTGLAREGPVAQGNLDLHGLEAIAVQAVANQPDLDVTLVRDRVHRAALQYFNANRAAIGPDSIKLKLVHTVTMLTLVKQKLTNAKKGKQKPSTRQQRGTAAERAAQDLCIYNKYSNLVCVYIIKQN